MLTTRHLRDDYDLSLIYQIIIQPGYANAQSGYNNGANGYIKKNLMTVLSL